jgi:hypothetical protein
MLLAVLSLAFAAGTASAGVIEPVRGQLNPGEDGYVLSATFDIDLGSALEEVLIKGVTLAFNLEFGIERKRWYWFDERIVGRVIDYRLSYNALTQQYRLSVGNLHSSHATLAEALRVLGHVEGLVVAGKSAITPGHAYTAELRLVLDKSQLPKPFQLDALANKTWQVDSKTLTWQFAPGVVGR